MLRPETPAQSRLRADIREWIAGNLPPDLRHRTIRPSPPEVKSWYRALAQRGIVAPHWPREHGGMAASPEEQIILMEEMARAGAPDLPAQGLNHIGPLLMLYGSEAQKREHLPKILSGEIFWAQGYSETGAGSDLMSLRTKGVVQGDALLVNGHKIWTTWAHYAEWLFLLVHTGDGKSKRNEITFVMLPSATPGVTVKPIRTLAGDDELAEVFLDNVVVPLTNVVGAIGQGWTISTALLAEERIRSGSPSLALRARHALDLAARYRDIDDDAYYQDRIAQCDVAVLALEAAYCQALESFAAGTADAEDCSRLKIQGAETTQLVFDVLQEIAGPLAGVSNLANLTPATPDFSQLFIEARRLSIRGGTNEIQRSILAMRALGLPRPGGG